MKVTRRIATLLFLGLLLMQTGSVASGMGVKLFLSVQCMEEIPEEEETESSADIFFIENDAILLVAPIAGLSTSLLVQANRLSDGTYEIITPPPNRLA